jgi:hypothetical protein
MQYDYYNWLMVFLRVSAFLLVLPFFSAVNFPVAMRVALATIVGLLLAPSLPPFPLHRLGFLTLIGAMIQEVSIGLLLGFVSRMVFYAADLAGNIVSTELGLNLGAIFNPMTQQGAQVPGTILFFLAAVVMLTLDLHHWVLLGFERTYLVLPMAGAHLNSALFTTVVGHPGCCLHCHARFFRSEPRRAADECVHPELFLPDCGRPGGVWIHAAPDGAARDQLPEPAPGRSAEPGQIDEGMKNARYIVELFNRCIVIRATGTGRFNGSTD